MPRGMTFCDHRQSAPLVAVLALPDSQAGAGRHKCVVCAFHEGRDNGHLYVGEPVERCDHGHTAPLRMLYALPDGQAGSGRHKCAVCAFHLARVDVAQRAEVAEIMREDQAAATQAREEAGQDVSGFQGGAEGTTKTVTVSVYERDPRNRCEAIRIHGRECAACGFNFDEFYGAELANGYVEIHHLVSVAKLRGRTVNPATEMLPLCSNCQSMAHRSTLRLTTIEEIKTAIQRQAEQQARASPVGERVNSIPQPAPP